MRARRIVHESPGGLTHHATNRPRDGIVKAPDPLMTKQISVGLSDRNAQPRITTERLPERIADTTHDDLERFGISNDLVRRHRSKAVANVAEGRKIDQQMKTIFRKH